MRIGVLALQGAFREHLDTLHAIGVEGVRVREPADLVGISGLILPGGESTTMRQLIDRWGLHEPILDLAERQGLLTSDQRWHVHEVMERCGRQRAVVGRDCTQRAPSTSERATSA